MLILIGVLSDECRQIEFGDALSNSRLSTDHVIRVYHVQNEPSCRVKCFLEPVLDLSVRFPVLRPCDVIPFSIFG